MDDIWGYLFIALEGAAVGGVVTGLIVWALAKRPWDRVVAAVPYLYLASDEQRLKRVIHDVAAAESIWAVARATGCKPGDKVILTVSNGAQVYSVASYLPSEPPPVKEVPHV